MGVGKAPLPPGKAGLFADDNLRKEQRRKAGGHDINRKPELPPLSQFQSKSRDMSAKDSMGAMNESRKMLPGEENNPNGPDFAAREMRFKGRKAPRMQVRVRRASSSCVLFTHDAPPSFYAPFAVLTGFGR